MKTYQIQNKTKKRNVFFENLEERSMVSSSVLGTILGALFVLENHENNNVLINNDVLSGTINSTNNTHSVKRILQKPFNSFDTDNPYSTDFLFDEEELSTLARSSGSPHSSTNSVTDVVFGNESNSFWNFLSDEPHDLTRQFGDDLLLNQTLQTKQPISTTKTPPHFSTPSSLPVDNTATSSSAGITVTSGGVSTVSVTTTPFGTETLQFTASSQTTLADNFTENYTQTYSEASYGDVYFCYAAVAGAHTAQNWTTPNVAPNVLVDTGYVFQTGNTASVTAEIWGEPVWEYVPWSVEILDPGTYWNCTYFSGPEFYMPDSMYVEKDFTWTKPAGLANNDSSIDRDFTFRFTVDDMYVDLNVHIAWAEYTIYVDSPNPGFSDIIYNNKVGHTFWEINVDPYIKNKLTSSAQAYVDQPFGYYPDGFDNKSLLQAYLTGSTSSYSVQGKLDSDSGHDWDVKKTYTINSLSSLQAKAGYTSFLASNPGTYNLNSQNCTFMAIFVGNYGGSLGISTTTVSGSIPYIVGSTTYTFNFSGVCPGQFGYELWSDPDAVFN